MPIPKSRVRPFPHDRSKTYREIGKRFTPVCPTSGDWVQNLGANVPDRIVTNLRKKVAR